MLSNTESGHVRCDVLIVIYRRLKQLCIAFVHLQHVYGISCAVGASALFAVGNLFIYAAGKSTTPFMVIVFDANITVACCVVFVALKRPQHLNRLHKYPAILFCGFLQTVAQFSLLFSITQIGPGNATALSYTIPIFALVYGYIFIKTKLHWSHFVFTISSIVGAVLVSRAYLESSSNEENQVTVLSWIGIFAALTTASSNAGVLVVRRRLSDSAADVDSILVVLAYAVQYSIASLTVCFATNSWSLPHSITDLLILLGSGPNGFLGTYLCYLAAYEEHPAIVSVILTLTVLFVFVGQIAIFNIKFYWMSFVGSILIMVACVGVAALSLCEHHDDEEERDGGTHISSKSQMQESDTLLKGEMSGETIE